MDITWFEWDQVRNGRPLLKVDMDFMSILSCPLDYVTPHQPFQSMIYHVFRDMLDAGVIAYMDDILIYSETIEEDVSLVRQVIEGLRKAR